MAGTFQKTETIVCSIIVKDADGTLADPATSMTITIYDPKWTAVVSAQAMTDDAGVGYYHYDYTPSVSVMTGVYEVRYKATDGARISIGTDSFVLEDI